MGNFSEALNVKANEVEKPPVSPIGHYRWKITKYAMGDMASDKGSWDTLDFSAKAVEALDDVDQTAVQEAGGINMIGGRVRFMFDKGDDTESKAKFARSQYNLTRFLTEHCGLPNDLSLRELIDRSKGAEFIANIKHRQDPNDPNIVYAEIDRTAPVNAPAKGAPAATEPAPTESRRRRSA